ncbi:MAG: CotH kinase family protein [Saprospiraceae bacterium]
MCINLVDREQTYHGIKTIRLSNATRDPSMVREVLGFEIARDYMTAPLANYLNLDINGEPYGLLINIQGVDEVFLNEHFNTSDGVFVKADPPLNEEAPVGCKKNIIAI